ncbi:type I restriction enzyme S subunit [Oceanihabitans sediminis]|uniref:Restriction endonuclease subunit S n=1 Tax=Oceanihabitans sediminis TaxID=1812012 RepID=A0A368P630_9FLAO|nr:restriction endonuclease subunit S [Oceanihabitans sediminis]RBP34226.1 type I restriction enzyme S subunit [Oceanihabitans sediminis]RCU57916.1 restriction endonuclease subunit S [Oceanihabitans sediminis]
METILLTEICNPKQWKTISSSKLLDSGYPVYGANGIIGYYSNYTHEEPTVLITCRGATCGKINVSEPKSYINGNAMALDDLSKEYDLNFLKYVLISRGLNDVISGSAQPQITRTGLKNIRVPNPPLKTQKQIASILDNAAALRDKTAQLLKEYDLLAQSIFLEMFGDVVNNPNNWKTKTIEQLVVNEKGSIKRGPFGGALKKEIFVEQGYLVYEQYHALNNDFNFERYFIDDENFERLKGFEVKPGDIIISCSGVYLGKLAIIPKDAKKGIINQALLKVTLDEQKMRKDFFVFHFTQQNFRDKHFGANRGAGIPNFPPMASFKKFPFIAPPIELQNQFAEKIDLIEKQKKLAKQELQESEDLFNCLLQKAFKGELV